MFACKMVSEITRSVSDTLISYEYNNSEHQGAIWWEKDPEVPIADLFCIKLKFIGNALIATLAAFP